jgi:hypothetical protein
MTRRDRHGKFIRECMEDGCTTRAQWNVEGYGFLGLYNTTTARYCKRHAAAATRRMNRAGAGTSYGIRDGYRSVKVDAR